jgi:hypothetical protein
MRLFFTPALLISFRATLHRWVVLLFLFSPTLTHAHGPFDHSARLIVSDTKLEFLVTLGADATRAFLTKAGGAEAAVLQILSQTTLTPASGLPAGLASRFFQGRVGEESLTPEHVSAITEGLETIFTVTFPRPPQGTLELEAIYFNGIEPMKQGSFVALDEHDQILGAALLSRAMNSIQFPLPEKITASPPPQSPLETDAHRPIISSSSQTTPSADANKPVSRSAPAGRQFGLIVLALVTLGLFFLFRHHRQKQASP